ncbi:MAG: hypothetical protein Q4B30_03155 [Coriobacteriaceae bacterium]|nr:hypothetical protein [Coriobacteriaceae bacterium]
MHYEGTLFDIKHVLRELNDNVARLTLANIAILDELHMIRRAVEGGARAYDALRRPVVAVRVNAAAPDARTNVDRMAVMKRKGTALNQRRTFSRA